MKFLVISDTHGKHNELSLPKADVIIHAGDICSRGYEQEVMDFLKWFDRLDYKYKIFIAGNHDFLFERESDEVLQKLIPPGIIYLNDSAIEIEGIKIWGSPITPWFFNWAFNRNRGEAISRHWEIIPDDIRILVTHGPPFSILDKTLKKEHVGCEDLLQKILEIKPGFHLFGHIHEAYGIFKNNDTTFINASVLDANYNLRNEPVVFEI